LSRRVLRATKASFWNNRYVIDLDGRQITVWDGSMWKVGGSFELEGQRYTVRANMWGSTYGMAGDDGTPVATARHVGRKRWTVESGDRTYEFQRASLWRADQELRSGGDRVGAIRRTSMWRTDAVADLPGLPVPVQIFVLAVVLTMWSQSDASAGGTAAATGAY
jgi:hypothetical protein